MMLKLKSSLLFAVISMLFYSCQKEYSIENNPVGGVSVFTYSGAPGGCTNAVVTGNYTAGTALASTNVVTIAVNVTTIGTYTITTPVSNGISFTVSGAFTTVGPQTISLTGTGIPIAAGTFSFNTGGTGCSFSVIVASSGGNSGGTAVYTINGAPGNCTGVTSTGTYTAGTALVTGNTASINVNVTTIGTYIITSNTANGITFTATGNFTTTGNQVVPLKGSGTPAIAGTFNYIPGTNGCTFSIVVGGGSVSTDFLICTIDGVAKTFNVNLFADKIAADTFDIGGDESTASNSPGFEIALGKSPSITTGTYNRYLPLTNTGTYCLAGYFDGVAVTWATGFIPASTGFSVVLTNFTSTRIDGTFSGTIYSDPILGTGPKVITAGKFSLPYQ